MEGQTEGEASKDPLSEAAYKYTEASRDKMYYRGLPTQEIVDRYDQAETALATEIVNALESGDSAAKINAIKMLLETVHEATIDGLTIAKRDRDQAYTPKS